MVRFDTEAKLRALIRAEYDRGKDNPFPELHLNPDEAEMVECYAGARPWIDSVCGGCHIVYYSVFGPHKIVITRNVSPETPLGGSDAQ